VPSGPINWGVLILQVGITAGLTSVLTLAGQLYMKRVDYHNSLRQKLWETQLPRLVKLKDTAGLLATHLPEINAGERLDELWQAHQELDALVGPLAEFGWLSFCIVKYRAYTKALLESAGQFPPLHAHERRDPRTLAVMRESDDRLQRYYEDIVDAVNDLLKVRPRGAPPRYRVRAARKFLRREARQMQRKRHADVSDISG
jgi:hypothetical protein